jgi:hypothetical protein
MCLYSQGLAQNNKLGCQHSSGHTVACVVLLTQGGVLTKHSIDVRQRWHLWRRKCATLPAASPGSDHTHVGGGGGGGG